MDIERYERLKRHENTLKALASRQIPTSKKRRIMNQKGGFMGQLAMFALPMVAQLLTSGIGAARRK